MPDLQLDVVEEPEILMVQTTLVLQILVKKELVVQYGYSLKVI